MRHVVFSYLPKSVMEKTMANDGAYRPQAGFLPLAPHRGQGPFFQQKLSAKYLKLHAKQAKTERERAALEDNAVTASNWLVSCH